MNNELLALLARFPKIVDFGERRGSIEKSNTLI